jgi:N-methylhydantoinase A
MHIHEMSTFTVLFDTNRNRLFTEYDRFNDIVRELERCGREDLLRQGMSEADIQSRLELDMRYGNQRVETTVVTELSRLNSVHDVLKIIDQLHTSYGGRFGEGSQAPETGVRINTVRICSFVEIDSLHFKNIRLDGTASIVPHPSGTRRCYFDGHELPIETPYYGEEALSPGTVLEGPAIVTTRSTTYLVEPGWKYQTSEQGAAWFTRLSASNTG